jgi:hypothetical protein
MNDSFRCKAEHHALLRGQHSNSYKHELVYLERTPLHWTRNLRKLAMRPCAASCAKPLNLRRSSRRRFSASRWPSRLDLPLKHLRHEAFHAVAAGQGVRVWIELLMPPCGRIAFPIRPPARCHRDQGDTCPMPCDRMRD